MPTDKQRLVFNAMKECASGILYLGLWRNQIKRILKLVEVPEEKMELLLDAFADADVGPYMYERRG